MSHYDLAVIGQCFAEAIRQCGAVLQLEHCSIGEQAQRYPLHEQI